MSEKKPKPRKKPKSSEHRPPWAYGRAWISSFKSFGTRTTYCRECYAQIKVWKSGIAKWPPRILCHNCLAINWRRKQMAQWERRRYYPRINPVRLGIRVC